MDILLLLYPLDINNKRIGAITNSGLGKNTTTYFVTK